MKKTTAVPYLHLVGAQAPTSTERLPVPLGVGALDWEKFCHAEDIAAGKYNWYLAHGGPFVPDAELKAQGRIPADWSYTNEYLQTRFGVVAVRDPSIASSLPGQSATDSAQSVPTPQSDRPSDESAT